MEAERTTQSTTEAMQRSACSYIRNGRNVIPVPANRKDPDLPGWQNLQIAEYEVPRYWTNGQNIGLKPGEQSGNLADVDLDRSEARAVAKHILKDTRTTGREGQEHGHRWYRVINGTLATKRYHLPGDGNNHMVVELRWTGCQTLVPPSIYPEGDRCVFGGSDFTEIDAAELICAVEDTAIAALMLIHYPGVGSRHEFCKHASGYLLRRLPLERVQRIVRAVVLAAGDPEVKDRLRLVDDTARKIEQGEKTTGGPQLEKMSSAPVCKIMRGWFGWGEGRDDGLPRVLVSDRPLRHKSDDAFSAVIKQNDPPEVFVRSGHLARIGEDESGEPVVQEVGESRMRHILTRKVNFLRSGRNGELAHVSPPEDVVKDIIARPSYSGLPALVSIARIPFFAPSGELVTKPGYHQSTGTFYVPTRGLTVDVPEKPTLGDLNRAGELLNECFGDFPYADKASAANAVATVLTPVMRSLVAGPAPLAAIDKPTPGTGASLFADVIAYITTGRPAGMADAPRTDEEMRKQITSSLIAGNDIIVIDNVAVELNHPSLARALTAEVWEDRILGRSEMIKLPQRATWIASGNNIQLGGDIPRRCYQVRLDAKTEKPWERRGFQHSDLKKWVADNRGDIVSALLTFARSWFAEGCEVPDGLPKLGGFDRWVSTIGGVLANMGICDFLSNLDDVYERSAGGAEGWETFLAAWRTAYGDESKKTKDLVNDLRQDKYLVLREAVPDELAVDVELGSSGLSRKLGKAFAAKDGRRFGPAGLYLKRLPKHEGAVRWKVENTPSDGNQRMSFMSFMSSSNPNAETKSDCKGEDTKEKLSEGGLKQTTKTHETHENMDATIEEAPNSLEEADDDWGEV